MPQMAPMWWSTMFLVFIMTYSIIIMMTYFYNIYKLKTNKNINMNINNEKNWKW